MTEMTRTNVSLSTKTIALRAEEPGAALDKEASPVKRARIELHKDALTSGQRSLFRLDQQGTFPSPLGRRSRPIQPTARRVASTGLDGHVSTRQV